MRRETIRRLRREAVLLVVLTVFLVAAGATEFVCMASQAHLPPSLLWVFTWAGSFWFTCGAGAIILVLGYYVADRLCLCVESLRSSPSDKLTLDLGLAYYRLHYIDMGGQRHWHQLQQRNALITVADTFEQVGGSFGPLTDKSVAIAFDEIACALRLTADEAVLKKAHTWEAVETKIVAALVASVSGQYGDLRELLATSAPRCAHNPLLPSIFRTLYWIGVPVVCVLAISVLVPGRWPNVVSSNWKAIAAVWIFLSISKGFHIDLSEAKELIRPMVSRL